MVDPIESVCAHVIVSHRGRCRVTAGSSRVGSRRVVPVQYGPRHDDRLILVRALTEEPLAEFRRPVIDSPSFVLNGVGRLGWTCSVWDDALDHLTFNQRGGAGVLRLIGTEVQWWRDGVLRSANVPTSAQVSMGSTISFEAPDLGYYFQRRMWGAAERHDLLKGIGSMDRSGLPGWSRTESCVAVRDTASKKRGLGSAALTGEGGILAGFPHGPIRVGQDERVMLTAIVKMPVGTPVGTEIMSLTVKSAFGGSILDRQVKFTDQDYTPGTWQRVVVSANIPVGAPTPYVQCYLRSENTHGTTRFDDVRALKNDTTGINPGADLTRHGIAALNHWQNPKQGNTSFLFRGRQGAATGTVEQMGVRHLEHTQAIDWLDMMTARSDGFDWWIDPRTREVWFAKRRGHDHELFVLHTRNVHGGGWNHDESGLASKQIVIGDGDGADRPEGGKSDGSRTARIFLDDAYRPPNGTPLSALDPLADQLWDEHTQPQVAPQVRVSADLIDVLTPGDRVNCEASTGKVRLPSDQQFRIAQIEVDMDSDELVLT